MVGYSYNIFNVSHRILSFALDVLSFLGSAGMLSKTPRVRIVSLIFFV
jgi:hypothetical protein